MDKSELIVRLSALYPRIAQGITVFWGYKEFNDYVEKLFTDTRGNRVGFSKEAMTYIMLLKDLHDKEFPELNPEPEGWASTFY